MLRQGSRDDLTFIRSIAGRAENAAFITDEDETALQTYSNAPDCEILIWQPAGHPAGFAIICEIGDPSGRVELMRLALADAGQGLGAVFLRALIDRAFKDHSAKRVWLDCSGENLRGQRAYARAGFTLEGRLRQHDYLAEFGRYQDTLYFGMLRDEWLALEPLRARP